MHLNNMPKFLQKEEQKHEEKEGLPQYASFVKQSNKKSPDIQAKSSKFATSALINDKTH